MNAQVIVCRSSSCIIIIIIIIIIIVVIISLTSIFFQDGIKGIDGCFPDQLLGKQSTFSNDFGTSRLVIVTSFHLRVLMVFIRNETKNSVFKKRERKHTFIKTATSTLPRPRFAPRGSKLTSNVTVFVVRGSRQTNALWHLNGETSLMRS